MIRLLNFVIHRVNSVFTIIAYPFISFFQHIHYTKDFLLNDPVEKHPEGWIPPPEYFHEQRIINMPRDEYVFRWFFKIYSRSDVGRTEILKMRFIEQERERALLKMKLQMKEIDLSEYKRRTASTVDNVFYNLLEQGASMNLKERLQEFRRRDHKQRFLNSTKKLTISLRETLDAFLTGYQEGKNNEILLFLKNREDHEVRYRREIALTDELKDCELELAEIERRALISREPQDQTVSSSNATDNFSGPPIDDILTHTPEAVKQFEGKELRSREEILHRIDEINSELEQMNPATHLQKFSVVLDKLTEGAEVLDKTFQQKFLEKKYQRSSTAVDSSVVRDKDSFSGNVKSDRDSNSLQ